MIDEHHHYQRVTELMIYLLKYLLQISHRIMVHLNEVIFILISQSLLKTVHFPVRLGIPPYPQTGKSALDDNLASCHMDTRQ